MSKPDRAAVFAALGDPLRLALLLRVADGGSVSELAAGLPVTRQAVSRHLHVLEQAGLIEARRAGREMRFAPRPARLVEATGWLDEVARQWDGALSRLKALAQKEP